MRDILQCFTKYMEYQAFIAYNTLLHLKTFYCVSSHSAHYFYLWSTSCGFTAFTLCLPVDLFPANTAHVLCPCWFQRVSYCQ